MAGRKETPAERRDRMYNEAIQAARSSRNVIATGAMDGTMTQTPSASTPVTRSPAIDLLNSRYRQQWMQAIENGSTSLPFNEWMNERAHGMNGM